MKQQKFRIYHHPALLLKGELGESAVILALGKNLNMQKKL